MLALRSQWLSRVRGSPWYHCNVSQGRVHLKDEAFNAVRALLLSGELAPGSFVSERQLVARLGMSKTPIRVAMERLARDGFVEILPQRGVRVRELDLREIVEHYELREALEVWTVRRVAERITDQQIGDLRTLVSRQRELRERVDAGPRRPDPMTATSYIELDAELHETLAEIAGNREVARVMSTLRQRISRVIADIILHNRPLLVSSIAEHQRIVNALAKRDADAAAEAMLKHLEMGKRQFLERATPEQRATLPARYQAVAHSELDAVTRVTGHGASSNSQTPRRTSRASGSAQPPARASNGRASTQPAPRPSTSTRTGSGRRLASSRTNLSGSRTASASTENGSDAAAAKHAPPRNRTGSAKIQKSAKGSPGRRGPR